MYRSGAAYIGILVGCVCACERSAALKYSWYERDRSIERERERERERETSTYWDFHASKLFAEKRNERDESQQQQLEKGSRWLSNKLGIFASSFTHRLYAIWRYMSYYTRVPQYLSASQPDTDNFPAILVWKSLPSSSIGESWTKEPKIGGYPVTTDPRTYRCVLALRAWDLCVPTNDNRPSSCCTRQLSFAFIDVNLTRDAGQQIRAKK